MECNRDEALRAKEIAEKRLAEHDYSGAKKLLQKALQLYPLLEGLVQPMQAVIDVHSAAQEKVAGNESDWYRILQVEPTADYAIIKKQYRKLALNLHPDKNKCLGSEAAFKLISEAWTILSDKNRRTNYDIKRAGMARMEFMNTKMTQGTKVNGTYQGHPPAQPPVQKPKTADGTFWTQCPTCKMQYQYYRKYENCYLLCHKCKVGFLAKDVGIPAMDDAMNGTYNWTNVHAQKQRGCMFNKYAADGLANGGIFRNGFVNGFSSQGTSPTGGATVGGAANSGRNVAGMSGSVNLGKTHVNLNATGVGKTSKGPNTVGASKLENYFPRMPTSPSVASMSARAAVPSPISVPQGSPGIAPSTAGMASNSTASGLSGMGPADAFHQLHQKVRDKEELRRKEEERKRLEKEERRRRKEEMRKAREKEAMDKKMMKQKRREEKEAKRKMEFAVKRLLKKQRLEREGDEDDEDECMERLVTEEAYRMVRRSARARKNVIYNIDGSDNEDMEDASASNRTEVKGSTAGDGRYDENMWRELVELGRQQVSRGLQIFLKDHQWDMDALKKLSKEDGAVDEKAEEEKVMHMFKTNDDDMEVEDSSNHAQGPVENKKPSLPEKARYEILEDSKPESCHLEKEMLIGSTVELDSKKHELAGTINMNCDSSTETILEAKDYSVPDADFYDFDQDRTENDVKLGQVWALYDEEDGMPRLYCEIKNVISRTPFQVEVKRLMPNQPSVRVTDWENAGFTLTCGDFKRRRRLDTESQINVFSHLAYDSQGQTGVIKIYPKKGEVWALFHDWDETWFKFSDEQHPKSYKYDMVEVVSDFSQEQGVQTCPLLKVPGFKTVFCREDSGTARSIPADQVFRFSHRVPTYAMKGDESPDIAKGWWQLDPASTPLELIYETRG